MVLVDTSAGLTPAICRARPISSAEVDSARGRNWMRVIPFARATFGNGRRDREDLEPQTTAGEAGRATDIEAAIRDGVASMPGGMVPRLVVSDGNENEGSVARAAWLARDLRVPIDTFALTGPAAAAAYRVCDPAEPSLSPARSFPSIW